MRRFQRRTDRHPRRERAGVPLDAAADEHAHPGELPLRSSCVRSGAGAYIGAALLCWYVSLGRDRERPTGFGLCQRRVRADRSARRRRGCRLGRVRVLSLLSLGPRCPGHHHRAAASAEACIANLASLVRTRGSGSRGGKRFAGSRGAATRGAWCGRVGGPHALRTRRGCGYFVGEAAAVAFFRSRRFFQCCLIFICLRRCLLLLRAIASP